MRVAALILAAAVASPALATDWHYVDRSTDGANITFIDKDSIATGSGGTTRAAMYSVLAQESDGAAAFRFELEVDCPGKRSRMTGAEVFGPDGASRGKEPGATPWETPTPGTQAETITGFVCARGASSPKANGLGSAYPFARAKQMLAERAQGKN